MEKKSVHQKTLAEATLARWKADLAFRQGKRRGTHQAEETAGFSTAFQDAAEHKIREELMASGLKEIALLGLGFKWEKSPREGVNVSLIATTAETGLADRYFRKLESTKAGSFRVHRESGHAASDEYTIMLQANSNEDMARVLGIDRQLGMPGR